MLGGLPDCFIVGGLECWEDCWIVLLLEGWNVEELSPFATDFSPLPTAHCKLSTLPSHHSLSNS